MKKKIGIIEEKIEEIAEGKVLEIIEEEVKKKEVVPKDLILSSWEPKTRLGREVKEGKIKNIDEILDSKQKILEEQIVDSLLILKSDLISIGQSKGKFGGGKRRAWRQTQRKTKEGNVPTFSTMAVVGDENGHIGIGDGKAKETLPARAKALRKAKLNLIRIKRTCAAFDCACSEPHTIPFKVQGKAGSVRIDFSPAPQGTGLVVANELKKVLKLAGIKDIYSKTFGKKRTSFNLIKACMDALNKTNTKR
jgi:small subunit ribosomal protein S5